MRETAASPPSSRPPQPAEDMESHESGAEHYLSSDNSLGLDSSSPDDDASEESSGEAAAAPAEEDVDLDLAEGSDLDEEDPTEVVMDRRRPSQSSSPATSPSPRGTGVTTSRTSRFLDSPTGTAAASSGMSSSANSGSASGIAGLDSAAAVASASGAPTVAHHPANRLPLPLYQAYAMDRNTTQPIYSGSDHNANAAVTVGLVADDHHHAAHGTPPSDAHGPVVASTTTPRGRAALRYVDPPLPVRCINPASEVNARLDTQVEVRVYPCNNSQSGGGPAGGKKKFTSFTIKPEGVVIQGNNRNRPNAVDLGTEYGMFVGRKLQRYELSDTRACQLLVTTHAKNFWVVPAPEAFSRHSGTCRLLGDRKHPPAPHTLQVGDFLRVGSVGVVVIETHDGIENRVLSEEKIQRIMKDTTNSNGGFLDLAETDGENSDDSMDGEVTGSGATGAATGKASAAAKIKAAAAAAAASGHMSAAGDSPVCYMCFDEEDTAENPMITPCKCSGDTKYVHVECLRKWHTAEADNQICFLSSVDATCSVCKTTFKSDFKLKDGRQVKLFKSSLEPPYVSLLVATKHEMAQRLFNTRFQLSFSTLLKPDGRNATRPLLLGRSSGSDMVLDYRTVSARHASIKFKNGEFVFTDAGSSNGSYLYLRRPLQLSSAQPVQFRLGRSMISMKVVSKWNRRLLRAVRRTGASGTDVNDDDGAAPDDRSIGSADGDVRVTDGDTGLVTRTVHRRSRESVMRSLPPPGQLSQQSSKHLDLLYALAYPKRDTHHKDASLSRSAHGAGGPGAAAAGLRSPKQPQQPPVDGAPESKEEEEHHPPHHAAAATAGVPSPTETVGLDP